MVAGLVYCLAAFATVTAVARYGVGHCLGAAMAWGYAYGILRARLNDGFSHMIFDAATLAVYVSVLPRPQFRSPGLAPSALPKWVLALVGWPAVLMLLPVDHIFIQLVGFRFAAFFLLFMLLPARMRSTDWRTLALWLAVLNVGALAVGLLEYRDGIEAYIPRNAMTELVYRSGVGGDMYRIPSTFSHAHAFGGTMVMSIPILVSVFMGEGLSARLRVVLIAGLVASVGGILLSATRTSVVSLVAGLAVTGLTRGPGLLRGRWLVLLLVGAAAAYYTVAKIDTRMQRFRTLEDTGMVAERVGGPLSRLQQTLEVVVQYPLGNGLTGAFGVSVPQFLRQYVDIRKKSVDVESEYGRIAGTQGLLGLLLYVGFFVWLFTRPRGTDYLSRFAFGFGLTSVLSAVAGVGLLSAVPTSPLLLLLLGRLGNPAVGLGPHAQYGYSLAAFAGAARGQDRRPPVLQAVTICDTERGPAN
jgi:hypothetical protein